MNRSSEQRPGGRTEALNKLTLAGVSTKPTTVPAFRGGYTIRLDLRASHLRLGEVDAVEFREDRVELSRLRRVPVGSRVVVMIGRRYWPSVDAVAGLRWASQHFPLEWDGDPEAVANWWTSLDLGSAV